MWYSLTRSLNSPNQSISHSRPDLTSNLGNFEAGRGGGLSPTTQQQQYTVPTINNNTQEDTKKLKDPFVSEISPQRPTTKRQHIKTIRGVKNVIYTLTCCLPPRYNLNAVEFYHTLRCWLVVCGWVKPVLIIRNTPASVSFSTGIAYETLRTPHNNSQKNKSIYIYIHSWYDGPHAPILDKETSTTTINTSLISAVTFDHLGWNTNEETPPPPRDRRFLHACMAGNA